MSTSTTIDALKIGIESIQLRADLTDKTKSDCVRLLQAMMRRDWYIHWDKESIINALMAYKEEHGVAPTVTNLSESGMPKNLTIQTHFSMKASLLLKRLFPEQRTRRKQNPWGLDSREEWLACFREQFDKHKSNGMTSKKYDVLRDPSTPSWGTIARYCGIDKWTGLVAATGVKIPSKGLGTATTIRITESVSPLLDDINSILGKV